MPDPRMLALEGSLERRLMEALNPVLDAGSLVGFVVAYPDGLTNLVTNLGPDLAESIAWIRRTLVERMMALEPPVLPQSELARREVLSRKLVDGLRETWPRGEVQGDTVAQAIAHLAAACELFERAGAPRASLTYLLAIGAECARIGDRLAHSTKADA